MTFRLFVRCPNQPGWCDILWPNKWPCLFDLLGLDAGVMNLHWWVRAASNEMRNEWKRASVNYQPACISGTPDLVLFYLSEFIDWIYACTGLTCYTGNYEAKSSLGMSLIAVSRYLNCWKEIKSSESIKRNGDSVAVSTSLVQRDRAILVGTITGLQKASHPSLLLRNAQACILIIKVKVAH